MGPVFDFAISRRMLDSGQDMLYLVLRQKLSESTLIFPVVIHLVGKELRAMIGDYLLIFRISPKSSSAFLTRWMLFSVVVAAKSPPARMNLELSSRTTQNSLPLNRLACQSRWTAVRLCFRSNLIQRFLRFFFCFSSLAKPFSRRTWWIALCDMCLPYLCSIIFSMILAPEFCSLWIFQN